MIDLQLHTTDSDGTWAWDRVLEEARKIGLTAFAITDHDTVIRHHEIQQWAGKNRVLAIPGVELSTAEMGQTVHLLGYFLEGPLDKLEEKLKYLRAARGERNKKIIAKLRELKIDVSVEELKQLTGGGTEGRPHIARLLLQRGVVKTIKEAFDRFLAVGASAYYSKDEIPLREGIDLLHGAGAVAVVAHPILLDRTPDQLETSFKQWASWGLDGLEGLYPSYKEEQTAFMNRMASKYGFLLTGGSDFHGDNKPHIKIGVGTGNLKVPDDLLEPLLNRKNDILKEIKGEKRPSKKY